MGHLGAGACHEQLGRQMRARADAGGTIVQLAGLGLGQRDQFLDVVHRQVLAHDEHMLEGAGAGQRREILHRVVARLLQHEHVVAVRLVVAERDRLSVGPGLGDGTRADGAGAARDVLDHHLLAERARNVGGDDARDHVGGTAGRVGHDHLDRSRGLPRRLCVLGKGGLHEGRGEQAGAEQTALDHGSGFLGV